MPFSHDLSQITIFVYNYIMPAYHFFWSFRVSFGKSSEMLITGVFRSLYILEQAICSSRLAQEVGVNVFVAD